MQVGSFSNVLAEDPIFHHKWLWWEISDHLSVYLKQIVAERWEEVLVLMGPSFLLALQINTETEERFDDSRLYSEKEENVNYSAISTGYFPYYRSNEEQFLQPLLYGLNAEGEKPESNCKDEGEGGCVELGGDAEKVNCKGNFSLWLWISIGQHSHRTGGIHPSLKDT